jgi:protein-disulfide isomerase
MGARLIAAVLSLLLLTSPVMAKPVARVPATSDWTRSFSITPEGGFRMGNPKAKVALVEYGSLVCPHCRHFAETGVKPLMAKYVRTGAASYEFRPLILSGVDVAATLIARCGGPSRFFPVAAILYANQPQWLGKINDAQIQQLGSLPQGQMMLGIARLTGLIPIAAAHGIPPASAQACLKNEGAATKLAAMAQAANGLGIDGTPTFFVNGQRAAAYDWPTLEPFLKPSGG